MHGRVNHTDECFLVHMFHKTASFFYADANNRRLNVSRLYRRILCPRQGTGRCKERLTPAPADFGCPSAFGLVQTKYHLLLQMIVSGAKILSRDFTNFQHDDMENL